MTVRANLIGLACADKAEAFKRIRDWICKRNGTYDYSVDGLGGWVLHDAVYATDEDTIANNDYFVIRSPGESGDEDLYFQFTYLANYIKIVGYLSWNNSAHTGEIAYNSNSIAENITTTSGNNSLSVGPITIASGYTVTVASGTRWVIL